MVGTLLNFDREGRRCEQSIRARLIFRLAWKSYNEVAGTRTINALVPSSSDGHPQYF